EAILVAVADGAAADPVVAEEGPVLAAQVLQDPALVVVPGDLEMARLDLGRVHPDAAGAAASAHAGEVDHLDGHAAAVQAASVEHQVQALRERAFPARGR